MGGFDLTVPKSTSAYFPLPPINHAPTQRFAAGIDSKNAHLSSM